jgi:hypothetical protein
MDRDSEVGLITVADMDDGDLYFSWMKISFHRIFTPPPV